MALRSLIAEIPGHEYFAPERNAEISKTKVQRREVTGTRRGDAKVKKYTKSFVGFAGWEIRYRPSV